ncbi:SDR family NAD(P)-dependent oxidoreductase [Bowmanella dokdonensis]|uniref:SDR family oxidoreductase n=1 Tax=Bowmanella dokdonensis TaxID=751969 RepID=A0A939DS73_9ALTE|nr:SDR family oxidoreductase [Bowmanella dokdonensis]MBN7827382.1 SDR family oxidoreductase [Bowmanella dokdonensis]
MSNQSSGETRYSSLLGKSIFITGGGTGIGAAMVERFCLQGARVTFVDIADAPSRSLCKRLAEQRQVHPLYIPCDIRDIDALKGAIEQARCAHGDIGVLINNAADDTRHEMDELTVEYWDDRLAINLRPCFFSAQAVVPQMQRLGGGSIINLGSISWRLKQTCMPAYTTAKAGIEGLTRTLAGQHGKDHIRVNTLIPGWVMTERQVSRWINPDIAQEIQSNQCIKETLQPDDIVNAALFLASDDSRMLTAQTLIVDGGWV